MKKAWEWLKRNATALLGAIVALFVAIFFIGRERKKRLDAEAQAAVEKAKTEIAALQARREALIEQVDAKDEQVQQIDQQLADNKKAIVEAHRSVEGMTPKEIEDEFARLGY